MGVDFVRHIVNPILSRVIDVEKGEHVKILDEIRGIISDYEEKYGFSVYGGEVDKLVDFLNSSDFDYLVKVFDTYGLRDALVDILEEALEAYRSHGEISKAIESRIIMLKNNKGIRRSKDYQAQSIDELVATLKLKYSNIEFNPSRKEVRVELREGKFAKIKLYRRKIAVNMVIELKDNIGLLDKELLGILECFG